MSQLTERNAINAAYEKWSPLAADAPDGPLTSPVKVILGEAVDVATLYNTHWNPTPRKKGPPLPGFAGVAEKSEIHEDTGSEIYELLAAAAKTNADYSKLVQSSAASPMERAEFVLYEIKATLEFVFDDDEHTIADDQLEKLSTEHSRPTSHDGMAVALEAYVALADEHKEHITGIDGFDLAMLDEALVLAGALRSRSGEALVGDLTSGVRELLSERNRLVTMLQDRISKVRRAARYVFRAHPDIAQKFSSAYERTRRRDLRRRQEAERIAAEKNAAEDKPTALSAE